MVFPFIFATSHHDGVTLNVMLWCLTPACINSCINPFIYVYKFVKFRRNVRKLFQESQKHFGGISLFNTKRRNDVNPMTEAGNYTGATKCSAWLPDQGTAEVHSQNWSLKLCHNICNTRSSSPQAPDDMKTCFRIPVQFPSKTKQNKTKQTRFRCENETKHVSNAKICHAVQKIGIFYS